MGLPACEQENNWSHKARKLKQSSSHNHQNKINVANHAISVAKTIAEKKRTNQTKLLLDRYGSSCYLQLLDDEPAPAENHLEEITSERITRAAMQRRMLLDKLLAKQHHVKHDHTYTSVGNEGEGTIVCEALKDEAFFSGAIISDKSAIWKSSHFEFATGCRFRNENKNTILVRTVA